ncbi:hypothetical protein FAIPA1_10403 [Frankia sp. AiPs1]
MRGLDHLPDFDRVIWFAGIRSIRSFAASEAAAVEYRMV